MATIEIDAVLPTKAVMQALGEITIRSSQLEYYTRLCVKQLAGVTLAEAIDSTDRMMFAQVRERVRKLAAKRFGETPTLVRVDALLTRAKLLSKERNVLVHGLWAAKKINGKALRFDGKNWHPLPKARDLKELADKMKELLEEIDNARLHGWLRDAIDKAKAVSIP